MNTTAPTPDGVLAFPLNTPKAAVVGVGLTSLALNRGRVTVLQGWTQGDTPPPDPQATWGCSSGSSSAPEPGRGIL
ncbi:hypothetical protein ACRAWF_35590 [Streptomyces sp. L7]